MATDISDKEMKALRDARWDKAFGGKHDDSSVRDSVNRKATIVIEHLIQARWVVKKQNYMRRSHQFPVL